MKHIEKLVDKTVTILGVQTNVLLYHNNPFRICDISANGNWEETGKILKKTFSEFITFAKINKLSTSPIGSFTEYLLDEKTLKALSLLKLHIAKPDYRIAWKLFWFNEDDKVYKKFPKDLVEFKAEGLTSHSLAIYYHFRAIQDSLKYINGDVQRINFTYWDSAFYYWNKVLNDNSFWNHFEIIAEKEKNAGYFDLRNFSIEKLKEEVIHAIYNSFIVFPQTIIEEELLNGESEFYFSQFLKCILKSTIGDESVKQDYAKSIYSIRLNKEITTLFSNAQFLYWANNGEYLKLYDTGLHFIDKIHEITNLIQDEAQNRDTNTTTFLSGISSLNGIHTNTVKPLIQTLKNGNVFGNDSVSNNDKEKTAFALLVIGLRILTELKIDSTILFTLKKEVNYYYDRFNFNKLTSSEITKLNSSNKELDEIHNKSFAKHKYLAQYCFFLEGEFAHPDTSTFSIVDTQVGNVITHNKIAIPCSFLAKQYHDKNISKYELAKEMKSNHKMKLLELELKNLDKEIEIIDEKIEKTQKLIVPINELIEKVNSATKKKNERIKDEAQKRVKKEKENSKEFKNIIDKQNQLNNIQKKLRVERDIFQEKYKKNEKWIRKIRIYVTILIVIVSMFLVFNLTDTDVSKDARIFGSVLIGLFGGGIIAIPLNYILGYSFLMFFKLVNLSPIQFKLKVNSYSVATLKRAMDRLELKNKKRIDKEIEPELKINEKIAGNEIAILNEKLKEPLARIEELVKRRDPIYKKKTKLYSSIEVEVKPNQTKHPINKHF